MAKNDLNDLLKPETNFVDITTSFFYWSIYSIHNDLVQKGVELQVLKVEEMDLSQSSYIVLHKVKIFQFLVEGQKWSWAIPKRPGPTSLLSGINLTSFEHQ